MIKGEDAGGVRWFLDGEPVHAGDGLEILLDLDDSVDRVVDFKPGWMPASPAWIPVRVEFDYDAGKAFVHWPTVGSDDVRSEVPETVLFRLPKG